MRFKEFVTEDEDVSKVLTKLPRQFRDLVKGYKFLFEPHNTLKGDDGHVGVITNHPTKKIVVAAPWRFSRAHTFLHEIGHLVYEKWVRGTPWEKEWEDIVNRTKFKKKDEPAEELWCHNFGSYFSDFPHSIHDHKEWKEYLNRLIRATT